MKMNELRSRLAAEAKRFMLAYLEDTVLADQLVEAAPECSTKQLMAAIDQVTLNLYRVIESADLSGYPDKYK